MRRAKGAGKPAPKPEAATLTEEMEARIKRDLQQTLNAALPDVLRESGRRAIPGADARELAGDQLQNLSRDKDAKRVFYLLSYEEQDRLLRVALPARSYSM